MKKYQFMKSLIAVVTAVFAISASTSFAQSAKSAVQLSNNTLIPHTTSQTWVPILTSTIRTSQQKDLIMGVSLETGLITDTLSRGRNGTEDTSWAEAMVQVRVRVGNRTSEPGIVTFDKRRQTLITKLGGVLTCTDVNGDGSITFDECDLTDEEIRLILDTMAAHHFNFVLDDLGSGDHTVVVEAQITTDTFAQAGASNATAAIGKGSLTVEEVRLVRGVPIVIN